MLEKIMGLQAVSYRKKTPSHSQLSDVQEVRERTSIIAFLMGMTIIAAAILLGRSYSFFIFFLAFSIIITLFWRKSPQPWIYLVSISAATPIAISRQQFPCNLVFAFWFSLLNIQYLLKLPKWIYVPTALAVIGVLSSSINWASDDVIRNIMRQGAFAYNFFLAPFLLLPVVYMKMGESHDHAANLQGLLFFLIIPSTLVLISARLFGSVANAWEASLHVVSLSEGFLNYKIGKVIVSFLRTEVGFILAALICASAAVTVSQVKGLYRLIAGGCLASNAFLLLATGSFGSIFACLCGLASIFFTQIRTINFSKVLVSVAVICGMLLMTYALSPPSIKGYLEKRYEFRVVKKDTDRLELWERAVEHILKHPEGVGLTLKVGDKKKTFVHNDYLVYTVSYGLIGGLGYAVLVGGLLFSFFRIRKKVINDPSALAVHLAGLGVIVAIAVNSITDHMNSNRWYFNVIWSLIWYSYFCSRALQTDGK
jgi:hypothetical protein